MTETSPDTSPTTSPRPAHDALKPAAAAWFAALRDRICAEFEAIEDAAGANPGRFERTAWDRPQGGGGVMSVMRGQVFEKVGVNISVVQGRFSADFAKQMHGADRKSRILGRRDQPGRAYALAQSAGRAHEHPHDRHHQRLVRRRRRFNPPAARHAGSAARMRHFSTPPIKPPATGTTRNIIRNIKNGATNISSCRTGARREALAGFFTIIWNPAMRSAISPSPAMSARRF